MRLALILTLLASPVLADFPETVQDHILPGYAAFAGAAQTLTDQAAQDCRAEALRPAFHAAYDAWMAVQHLRFGPVEQDGIGLSITFWPDPKGSGTKAQMALLTGDPAALTPENFADQSVAARGLTGLERLLYPKASLPADPCALIRATAADLARTAAVIRDAWTGGFADTVLTAGEAGNTVFLTRSEARQVLFTQIATGLEFDKDQRLGRPLGTFEKPHPERAEALASGRSLRNLVLSLQAMRDMVTTLTPDAPRTLAAFDRTLALAAEMDDPTLAGVAVPDARLKVEILQQSVSATVASVMAELAPELDVGIGFNAADGD